MSLKLYEEDEIQEIADAIREHNGSTDTYTVAEMSDAIQSLPVGGESGLAGIVPQAWITGDPTYITWIVRVQSLNIKSYQCNFYNYIGEYCTGTVYWGDGQSTSISDGYAFHTYQSSGTYQIYMSPNEGVLPLHGNYNSRLPLLVLKLSNIWPTIAHPSYNYFFGGVFILVAGYSMSRVDGDNFKYLNMSASHLIVPGSSVKSLTAIVNCYSVYVPDNLLSSYKTATNWSVMADYIYPFSQCPYIASA